MADPLPADTAGHVVNFQLVKEGRLEKIYVVKNDTIRTVKTRVSQALALGFDDPTAVTLVIDGKQLSDNQVAARTGMFNHNAKVYTIIAEPRFTITVRTQDGVCFPLKVDRNHTIETVKKNIAIEAMAVFSGAKQLPSAATVAMSGLEAGDTLDVFFPFLLSTTVPLQVALPNGSLDVMEVDPTATVAETKQLILAKYPDLEGAYCLVYQSKKLPPTATLEECALLGAEVVVELEKAGQTGEEAAEAAQQVEQAADGGVDAAPVAGGAPRRVDVDPLAGLAPVEFARTFSIQGILRSIDVSSRDKVVAVRRRIAAVLEISPHRVQLLFETRRIPIEEDNDLFTEHCPGGESAIHVLIKPVAPKAATPGGAAAVDGFDDNAVSDAAVADEQAINIMFRATNGADLEGNGVVELAVTISETVGAVRARLAEALGIAANRIVIVFEGKRMSDDKTLFFARDVSAASVVSLLIQTSTAPKVAAAVAADAADVAETAAAEAEAASLPEGTVELSFRFSGHDIQSTSIKVLMTDTVAVVRQRLSADQKIPVSRLRLISEGKRLGDDTVIDSVGLTTASVIHVLVAREMGAGAEGAPAAAAATAAGSAPSTSAARGNASAPAETGRMALLFSFARSNLGLISCEVPWTFTVGQVKAKLAAENEALDRDRIALVFNGMRLADDVAVAACPIGTSSIINAYMTPEAEAEPGVPELGALPAPDRSVAIRAPDARRVNLAYHSDDTVAMAMERLGRILGYQGSNLKLMNEGVRCKADETVAEVGLTQVSMAFALVNNITLCDRLAVLAPDDVERSVNVRSDDTIASVAERICSVYQLPSPDQLEILEYDVNSGATLQELGLLGGADISVLHPRWAAVATVATDSHRDNLEGLATPDKTVAFSYDGGSFTLPINMMDTAPDVMRRVHVSGLMDEFCATHGGLVPVDDLQLVFAGRRIHSGRALQDCGVDASSVIEVVIKEVKAPGLELDAEVEIQTPRVETPRTAADRIGAALVRLSDENRNEFLSLPINTPIGTQTVWVHKNDTIDEVKYRIDEEITRSGQVLPGLLEDMILVSNGVTLTSGKTVSDYPISQGSAVHALFQVDFEESEPAAVATTLCFRTTSGDIVNIDVNRNATANDVKKLVGERVGEDPDNLILVLSAKPITGNKPISEYEELSGMSTIQILLTGSSRP